MNTFLSAMRCGTCAIVTSALAITGVAAQSPNDPVPQDFVMALLRTYSESQLGFGASPRLIVGEVPPEVRNRIGTPPRARVLGSVVGQNAVDIIGIAPGPPDAVRAWFGQDFERRGFTPPNIAPTTGFRDPATAAFREAINSSSGYCDSFQQFTVTARQLDSETTEYRLRILSAFSACTLRSNTGFGGFQGDSALLPKLVNPPLSEPMQLCQIAASSPGQASVTTRYSSGMTATEIVSHYGRQLEGEGWKLETVVQGAIAAWARTDSTGRQYRAELSVTPIPSFPDCRSLQLRIVPIRW